MNYTKNLFMETLQKTHNSKLPNYVYLYLEYTGPDDNLLFNNLQIELEDMIKSGVIIPIIYYYILTSIELLIIKINYDLIKNYPKMEKIFTLIYQNESERKKVLSQTIAFALKTSLKLRDSRFNNSFAEMINKLLNEK